jgi:hypothetical protein
MKGDQKTENRIQKTESGIREIGMAGFRIASSVAGFRSTKVSALQRELWTGLRILFSEFCFLFSIL